MDRDFLRVIASSRALTALAFTALAVVALLVGFLIFVLHEAVGQWDGRVPGASPIVSIAPPSPPESEPRR